MLPFHAAGPAPALGPMGVATRPSVSGGPAAFPVEESRELWLNPDPRELRRARRLAEAAAADHGLDEDERFRFVFAANEAVANAIEHGAASDDGHILVRASAADAELSFEVHDWGSFTPGLGKAEALPDRGRGLALMAAMVDEVDVRPADDGTVVRLVLRAAVTA